MSHLDKEVDDCIELGEIAEMEHVPYNDQIKIIRRDAKNIKYIKNPCEEAQFLAFHKNKFILHLITNPTLPFQYHIIDSGQARQAISRMMGLDKEVLEYAFEKDPRSMLSLRKGTIVGDKLQLIAIRNCWEEDFYYEIIDRFERKDEESFYNEIKKMKLEFGPMTRIDED